MKDKKKFCLPDLYTGNDNINKRWYIFYYQPTFNGTGTKRIKIYAGINRIKTIVERKRYASKLIRQLLKDKPWEIQNIPKKSLLLETLEVSSGFINSKTYSTYKGMVEKFHEYLNKKSDYEANREDASGFINQLLKKGKSIKTIKAYRNNISSIYNRYIDLGHDIPNPFKKIKLPKSNSKSLMYFNVDQINRIKDYSQKYHPKLWLAIQLQYYCFIRPNELRQLKAKNINLGANYIEIDASISKNKRTQKVQIPNNFSKELKFTERLNAECNIITERPVMPIRDHLSKEHKKVLKALGINGRYGFYSWKHTGVVMAWKVGINIKDLQMQLRHHSLDMVNEYLKNLGVMDSERIRDLFPKI